MLRSAIVLSLVLCSTVAYSDQCGNYVRYFNGDRLDLYDEPQGQVKTFIPQGKFGRGKSIIDCRDGWVLIDYNDAEYWVKSDQVKVESTYPSRLAPREGKTDAGTQGLGLRQ